MPHTDAVANGDRAKLRATPPASRTPILARAASRFSETIATVNIAGYVAEVFRNAIGYYYVGQLLKLSKIINYFGMVKLIVTNRWFVNNYVNAFSL